MKITIEELDKQASDRIKKRKELKLHIADLEQREEALKEKAQEAAEAGSVVAYKSLSSEVIDIQTELIVARAQDKKLGSSDAIVTGEEADAAWKDFTGGYNRQFDKLYAELEKKRSDLLAVYSALIDLQYDAFEKRERLARYAGVNAVSHTGFDKPLDAPFPCRCLPDRVIDSQCASISGTTATDPDLIYYLACYAKENKLNGRSYAESKAVEKIRNIVARHSTKSF